MLSIEDARKLLQERTLRAPNDYGPKGPFVVSSARDPHGNCGVAHGYAWASWYGDLSDPDAVHIAVSWKPAQAKNEPRCEVSWWTKAKGCFLSEDFKGLNDEP